MSSGIKTKTDLKRAAAAAGSKFFSPAAMRHWGSRLEAVYETAKGAVFVTSENQMDDTQPRRFTIGIFDGVHTSTHEVPLPPRDRHGPPVYGPPGFQAFAKRAAAERTAASLARRLGGRVRGQRR